MNSTQRLIVDVLSFGKRGAGDILAALRLKGFKASIDELYVDLVAMEGAGLARIEGVFVKGRRVATEWALGRQLAPQVPAFTPERTERAQRQVDELLLTFARPTEEPAPGVLIHRCL